MASPDHSNDTKEKILQTTLDVIKREGFDSVTIRKIASRSDANIALVNYYFGSKDKLINEAIKGLLIGFRDTFDVFDHVSVPPKERLKLFLTRYVQVIQQYPELVLHTIAAGSAMFASQHEYGEFLQATGFHKLQKVFTEITGEERPDSLMMMVTQIFGAIFLPALMKPLLESGAGVKPAPIDRQIDFLFERYFPEHGEAKERGK
ncbi:TetR/AcrR family transcriptional regulator [Paenibacillus sp. ISL-20]|uniref:TetR/AcrR family transcriptional regulator n=1 Tax=Paenibacillus sp. ISL-20 TaxID=2819163 RepID=UPI001BECE8DA|nr:TetR/AcrR family transcriptional regulator [Paenibacillus sp. ISL-20]MBT2762625.1 TetR/AcrR family transcriptional regulator [Paenibacillus sp. ISL-20]